MLEKIGIPKHICIRIKYFYEDAEHKPNHAGKERSMGVLLSGTKQGCPLSPLLFVLIMDALTRLLISIVESNVGGFADDLALTFKDLSQLDAATRLVSLFSRASGVDINHSNSICLLSTDEPPWVSNWLEDPDNAQWLQVDRHSQEAEHLGILIGRKVTASQVWAKAWRKCQTAAQRWTNQPISEVASIFILNVFLSSILSYAPNFYVVPKWLLSAYLELANRFAFGIRVMPFDFATHLKKFFGLSFDYETHNTRRIRSQLISGTIPSQQLV